MTASQECVRLRHRLKPLLLLMILGALLSACAGNFDGKFCLPVEKVGCADLRNGTAKTGIPTSAVEGG